jgi:hypothetical protein
MSKPFNKELAAKEKETRQKLVDKLNKIFKKLKAETLSGKNTDIRVYDPSDPSFEILLEMEGVRPDRWDKIKSKYPTVRWPLAKKKKYKNLSTPLVMVSVKDDEEISDIFAVDYETWIHEGHEEKAPFVRAGGKAYSYRKGEKNHFGQ